MAAGWDERRIVPKDRVSGRLTTVAVMQPAYLPWAGYFDIADQIDLFILLDTVPVSRQSWQTRNRILDRNDQMVWLPIPIVHQHDQLLKDVRIADDPRWRRKHQWTLRLLGKHTAPILDLYESEWTLLTDFTTTMIRRLCQILGIRTGLVLASELGPTRTTPIERLEDLLEKVGTTEFLEPAGGKAWLTTDHIGNVPVRFHDYRPIEYEQNGNGFVSHLSVVDCLARHGPEKTLDVVRSGRMSSALP